MAEWYYGKGAQQFGPIDEATLRARIATGEVSGSDLIWTEGMVEWIPLSKVSQFSDPDNCRHSAPLVKVSVKTGDDVTFVTDVLDQVDAAFGELGDANKPSPYAPPAANPVASVVGGGVQLAPPTSGLAIASMVCGILSLFFCFCGGMLLGIPAVICGHMALKQTGSESPGMPPRMGGRGMAIAGLIMGYIGILLIILGIIGSAADLAMTR
jgi:hypothetical protein